MRLMIGSRGRKDSGSWRCFVLALVAYVFCLAFSAEAEEGVVAYYSFDAPSEIVKDKSGNENDGEVHGATYVKSGDGYALSFDGKDDYVDCGRNLGKYIDFQNKAPFTMEGWFKGSSPRRAVVAYSSGGTAIFAGINASPGRVSFGMRDTHQRYSTLASGNVSVGDDRWHHLVGVRHGFNKTIELYLDGELVAKATEGVAESAERGTYTVNDGYDGILGNSYYLRIANSGSSWLYYFRGTVDDIRIYSRALSAQEIKAKYDSDKKKRD